jgi:hypothetical protein
MIASYKWPDAVSRFILHHSRRTPQYAHFSGFAPLRYSANTGALHLDIFEQAL